MITPTRQHYNPENGTVHLWFRADDPDAPPNGWYRMRGGVCWPATVPGRHVEANKGAIVLCAQSTVGHRHAVVVGWTMFEAVTAVLRPDGKDIQFPGIGAFLNQARASYLARAYYWSGHWGVQRKWLLDVMRDATIEPKPDLVEVELPDWRQGVMGMMHALDTGSLSLAAYGPPDDCVEPGNTMGLEARLMT